MNKWIIWLGAFGVAVASNSVQGKTLEGVGAQTKVEIPYDKDLDEVMDGQFAADYYNFESPNLKNNGNPAPNDVGYVKGTSYDPEQDERETCMVLAKMPGARYHLKNKGRDIKGDEKKEKEFCQIDFWNQTRTKYEEKKGKDKIIGLCPKYWSTSPGTIVWDLTKTEYANNVKDFQDTQCRDGKAIGNIPGIKKLAKFKTTMNADGTSGTFSQSSYMYYHFSRFFHTDVYVPVSVYRSVDAQALYDNVIQAGKSISKSKQGKGSSGMNLKAWGHLENAAISARAGNPSAVTYKPWSELFTKSLNKMYGILIRGKGDRYSASFNGTRASGWGVGQNKDFMETTPFLAVRSEKALPDAINEGIEKSFRDPKIKQETGSELPGIQMLYWMREVTEIALLDYIFSQQDRIGNIDYRWYWYWVNDKGEMVWKKASTKSVRRKVKVAEQLDHIPAEEKGDFEFVTQEEYNNMRAEGVIDTSDTMSVEVLDSSAVANRSYLEESAEDIQDDKVNKGQDIKVVPRNAVLIQRTQLNDNDAGGRYAYANYTKKVGMLESIRHMSQSTYRQLAVLNKDLDAGPGTKLYDYIQNNFRLSKRQFDQIVKNVGLAFKALKATCDSGSLHFDLEPQAIFESGGEYQNVVVNCENGKKVEGELRNKGKVNVFDLLAER